MSTDNNTYQPKNPTSKQKAAKASKHAKAPKVSEIKEIKKTSKKEKKGNIFIRFLKYFIPWAGDKVGEIIRKILMIVVIAAFIFGSVLVVQYVKTTYETIDETNKLVILQNEPPTPEELAALPPGYLPEFAKYYSINPNVVGFLSIPDTNINHTVAQANNNDFYLTHNFKKNYNVNGWPFADYNNRILQGGLSDNTIIYGHNIRSSNLMFQNLVNFKKLDYYKARPVIEFDTVYEKGKWKIFGVFISNANSDQGPIFDYHKFFDADNDDHFNRYIREVKRRSIINTNVDVVPGDKLLTLSTCTYEIDDGRLCVVARRVRPGEDASVDVSKASLNPNPLYPHAWYWKNGGTIPTYNDKIPWGSGRGGSIHGTIN